MFWEEAVLRGPPGVGGVEATTNLSLRGAREEDFLLKFKTAAFSRGWGGGGKMYFSADNGLLFS